MTFKRNMTALLLGVFTASATLPGAGFAKDYAWGAIAVDLAKPDREPGYGAGGGATEDEAKADAMKRCKEYGNKSCKIVVTYEDCGAYAASNTGGGFGINKTKKTAEAKALSGCDRRQMPRRGVGL